MFGVQIRLIRRLRRNHIQYSGSGGTMHPLNFSHNTVENEEEESSGNLKFQFFTSAICLMSLRQDTLLTSSDNEEITAQLLSQDVKKSSIRCKRVLCLISYKITHTHKIIHIHIKLQNCTCLYCRCMISRMSPIPSVSSFLIYKISVSSSYH